MKIKSVILDTTLPYTSTLNPSLWQYNSQNLIDYQIKKIQNAGRTAIVVIGEDGDDILRASKELDSCDLVHSSEKIEFSGAVAGLHATEICAFYLPVSVPFPEPTVWLELEKENARLMQNHGTHILKPELEVDAFPWLITKLGRETILKTGVVTVPDLGQRVLSPELKAISISLTKTIG